MSNDTLHLDCGACRDRVHAYLDGELAEGEANAVARHLEDCTSCFERSELEESFRRSIRSRTGAAAAVPDRTLEERLRRALDDEDQRRAAVGLAGGGVPARGGRGLVALRTWTARILLVAAGALIAIAAWTTLTVPQVPDWEASVEAQSPAFVRGRLVCLDCLIMRTPVPRSGLDVQLTRREGPTGDTQSHHRLHFRSAGGRLWELFPEDQAAAALDEHDNAGREATIVGIAYPEIGVLRVSRVSLE